MGQWKDGTPDGNGVMTWVDASFYKGDFVDGLVSAFPVTLSDILCYITKIVYCCSAMAKECTRLQMEGSIQETSRRGRDMARDAVSMLMAVSMKACGSTSIKVQTKICALMWHLPCYR